MGIDPYSQCPGGSGKKVKFCCADLVTELDRIVTLRDSGQPAACLEYLQRVEAKAPQRACLLAIKAMLQTSAGALKDADKTLATYAARHPENPVPLAELAVVKAESGEVRRAVELTQGAIAASKGAAPPQLRTALKAVGKALLRDGSAAAALQHFHLASDLAAEGEAPDEEMMYLQMAAASSAEISPAERRTQALELAAEGSPAAADVRRAVEKAEHGRWLGAADLLAAAAVRFPEEPVVWKNLGVLRMWLGDRGRAADAWRKVAALAPDWNDRVEAEATAQELAEDDSELIASVSVTYPLIDLDQARERLTGEERLAAAPGDASRFAGPGAPPPQAVFRLLDQPLPSGEIDPANAPDVIGAVLLFGRETDRPPRALFATLRDDRFADATAFLRDALSGLVDGEATETDHQNEFEFSYLSGGGKYLPPETPADVQDAVRLAAAERAWLQRFPSSPSPFFGGKTPTEVAGDDAGRLKLEGLLLRCEHLFPRALSSVGVARVRQALGLPELTYRTVEISDEGLGEEATGLSGYGMLRLAVAGAPVAVLEQIGFVANTMRLPMLQRRVAEELLARGDQLDASLKASAHLMRAETELSLGKALEEVVQARTLGEQQGEPVDGAMLFEFRLRLQRGDFDPLGDLVREYQRRYGSDAEAMNSLYETLASFGLVRSDGAIMIPRRRAEAEKELVLPGDETGAEGGSKIWTPDQRSPAQQKPGLWTPGG